MTTTSEHKHYTPVIRWKPGEVQALTNLIHQGTDLSQFTPLVEPVPDRLSHIRDGNNRKAVERMASEIKQYCGIDRVIYLDFVQIPTSLCNLNGSHILSQLGIKKNFWSMIVPVTGLKPDTKYQVAVKNFLGTQFFQSFEQYKRLGLRLTPDDLCRRNTNQKISLLLQELNIERDSVDLIIDFAYLKTCPHKYSDAFARLPSPKSWRRIIFVGGNWPKDLGDYTPTATYDLARPEWEEWYAIHAIRKQGERLPTFGDYTVRHATYEELPGQPRTSASIRYTCKDKYLIFRGVAPKKSGGPGPEQYLGHAQLLVKRREYAGANFSHGDGYIMDRSNDLKLSDKRLRKPGNPRTWVEATVNHHITLVLDQLASLPDA